jgi:hypothetical protein
MRRLLPHIAAAGFLNLCVISIGFARDCSEWKSETSNRILCDYLVELIDLDRDLSTLIVEIDELLPHDDEGLPGWSMAALHRSWLVYRDQRCRVRGGFNPGWWTWKRVETYACRIEMAHARKAPLMELRDCLAIAPKNLPECPFPSGL